MNKTLTLYSKQGCAPCSALKKYLDSKRTAYVVVDIEATPEARQHIWDKFQALTVPVISNGEQFVIGANFAAINQLIREAA